MTISKSLLEKICREGLAYLLNQKDVEEAEIFAALNKQWVARICYTSHIPCNGVEEPKSVENKGLSVRCVFRLNGKRVSGFGSEPGDFSLEGVKKSLEKARHSAVEDPEFVSLPKPTQEKRKLNKYHDPRLANLSDKELTSLGWKVIEKALQKFQTAGLKKEDALILGGDVSVFYDRIAIHSSHMPKIQIDESTAIRSLVTAMVERKNSKGSGFSIGNRLSSFNGSAGWEAAKGAIQTTDGERIPDGEYRVILSPRAIKDLLEYLILPSLNAGTFYAGVSAFQKQAGKKISSEIVNLADDGSIRNLGASRGITCEGLPTGKTELIKNGYLVGLLSNFYASQLLIKDPQAHDKLGIPINQFVKGLVPRNGFRGDINRDFQSTPNINATNVILTGKKALGPKQLLRLVGRGVYIGRIWYTYPVNGLPAGDFSSTIIGDSYLIKNGELDKPLIPNTIRINDNIRQVMQNIIGVGKEIRPSQGWYSGFVAYIPEIAVSKLKLQAIAQEPSKAKGQNEGARERV